ncbi:hypothetical protein E4T56_gene188 [Termitomyces sp. T112]|nr:hypothetical protein E4T56_gene188 [Termitomyces sp. T112]KAH0586779.1 hypothetical protein H2248_005629 [Termitomyces sp. 'cryptogamus']
MASLRIVFFFLASALATLSVASPTAAERRDVIETATEDVGETSLYQRRGTREDAEAIADAIYASAQREAARIEEGSAKVMEELESLLDTS